MCPINYNVKSGLILFSVDSPQKLMISIIFQQPSLFPLGLISRLHIAFIVMSSVSTFVVILQNNPSELSKGCRVHLIHTNIHIHISFKPLQLSKTTTTTKIFKTLAVQAFVGSNLHHQRAQVRENLLVKKKTG